MFERMTERGRQVIVLAQDEARAFGHNFIGTEHLLLGLMREEDGLAQRVLSELKLSVEGVRIEIERIVGKGEHVETGQIPLTPRCKKVIELSLREALSLGHNYIGTEHILLGLVRENEGVAARILLDQEVTPEVVRNLVIGQLSGPNRYRDPGAPPPPPTPPRVLIRQKVTALKDQALDAGLTGVARRLREIEKELGE